CVWPVMIRSAAAVRCVLLPIPPCASRRPPPTWRLTLCTEYGNGRGDSGPGREPGRPDPPDRECHRTAGGVRSDRAGIVPLPDRAGGVCRPARLLQRGDPRPIA